MSPKYYILLLLLFGNSLFAQKPDSLLKIIQTSSNDSIRVKAYAELTEVCELNEIPSYVKELVKISGAKLRVYPLSDTTKYFYLKNTALALNNLGYYFENKGENNKAFTYFNQALSLFKLINDTKNIGTTYSNLGSVYDNLGDIRSAIDYYFKSLRIRESLQENLGMGNNLHNIASLYYRQGEFENAYQFSQKSLAIREKIKDKSGMASSHALMAQLCYENADTACAISNYLKSADYYNSLNEKYSEGRANTHLGKIYKLRGQFDKAREHYLKALDIYTKIGEDVSTITLFNNLSDIELATQSIASSLEYAQRAYALAQVSNNTDGLIESSKRLSKLYALLEKYKEAYRFFETYSNLSDSSKTTANRNTILLSNIQYQYQKKALADSIRTDKDKKLSELKLKEERDVKIFAISLFLSCAFFLIYLFRRYKLIQKQKIIIEKQKIEVEVQKQLADSRLAISESQKLLIQDSLDQLKKTQEKLIESKLEAEKANASKSTFIANVSHEIRTPLNAVLGFSELLKGSTIGPKYEKYIDNILAGGKSLMLLINDILDLSKMEAGHLVFHQKPVSLQNIIDDCHEWVAIKAAEKGLTYELICEQQYLNMQLLLDELRIRQIIFNLLGNAIKFTNKGSVQLFIMPEYKNETNLINLKISVKDTGPGIPPDQQQSIFEAFKQVNGQANRESGGTGLGLTITKHLVERLNGNITLQSVPGEGSTFTVQLNDVKIITDSLSEHSQLNKALLNFKGQSILLAEDTGLNQELIIHLLESHQLSVQLASNGQEAMKLLKTSTPDLILMDLMMPVMDGFEAAKQIKTDPTLKHIPIIALTALSYAEIEPSKMQHFDDYIQKPIRTENLLLLLSKFLNKK